MQQTFVSVFVLLLLSQARGRLVFAPFSYVDFSVRAIRVSKLTFLGASFHRVFSAVVVRRSQCHLQSQRVGLESQLLVADSGTTA